MQGGVTGRRKLWTMTCESLFQILSSSMTPEELMALCHKHQVPLPDTARHPVALFHLAHEQCHRDAAFSRQLQRLLHRKHAAVIGRLAHMSPELADREVHAVLSEENAEAPRDVAGLLWAVASDPRPEMRPVEQAMVETLHLLSHCLVLAQFRGEVRVVRPEHHPPAAQLTSLQQEIARLRDECRHQQASLQQLQQQRVHLARENDHLQRQLQALRASHAALQQREAPARPPAVGQGNALRDLRKLRYQHDRLLANVALKDAELQRLHRLVQSSEAARQGADHGVRPTAQAGRPTPAAPPQALGGKTVALIGGLDGLAAHYERLIQEFGGGCIWCDGKQNQKRLAQVIQQADIVFCPVDCNSHGAAASAKKLCRTLNKSCYFLRSSGISHVREKLIEITTRG